MGSYQLRFVRRRNCSKPARKFRSTFAIALFIFSERTEDVKEQFAAWSSGVDILRDTDE